jgi:hypothetical protein
MISTKLASIGLAASLAAILPVASAQAQAPRTFVSAAGSDSNPCSFAAPCRHFQAAVNATTVGGEVDALDPAGYGPIIISHAITIEGQSWSYIAPPAGGNGITINAVSGNVAIRGVSLNGAGITGSTNGIVFNSGDSLTVTDCVVQNFGNDGIEYLPAAASNLSVSNTTAVNNGRNGIFVFPSGSGAVESVFNRVQTSTNADSGIVLDGANSTGTLKGTVYESVSAQNGSPGKAGLGFFAFSSTGHASTTLMVFHSASVNNLQGMAAQGGGATLRVANSTITGNGFSWGGVVSYGDNYIDGNSDGDPTPPLTARK